MPGTSQQLVLPATFLKRYTIGEVLGEGACGKAYRAEDRELSRPVAIKILVRHEEKKLVDRFMREGQLLAKITDPNVVRVYDLDLLSGHPCLVMELVDGVNLKEHLASTRLTVERSLTIALQALKGLAACHAAGVVHRDLKPENLLIAPDGTVKIADLGVARYADAISNLTRSGELVGTPRYMAPEQIAGDEATTASDLHAIGTILFEMLSGERAYQAPNLPALFHLLSHAPIPDLRTVAPHVPAEVAELVKQAMARDPAARPASASQMAGQVRLLLSGDIDTSLPGDAPSELARPLPTPQGFQPPKAATARSSGTRIPARTSAPRPVIASGQNPRPPPSEETAQIPIQPRRLWPAVVAGAATLIAVAIALRMPKQVAPTPSPTARPVPAAPPAATDLSSWQDLELWSVHTDLQQIALLQRFRRDEWSNLHTYITPGNWDMHQAETLTRQLQASTETDARSLAAALSTLRGLPARSHNVPLEAAMLARLRGLLFVSQFIHERLDHYLKELPHDDVLDPERMARVDNYQFSEGLRVLLSQFATDAPAALAAAIEAHDDSRDLPGVLLQDIARVSEWLHSAGRGGQSSPQIVSAVTALKRAFATPPDSEIARKAFAVAATSWAWGDVGAGTKVARANLHDACEKLAALEHDLPRSRASLEAHRKLLEQSLASREKPAGK